MNYLGYSYGTFLGATYAGLFPDKVGRFVLDGALDPSLNVNQVSDLQMRGFEDSLSHWIEDCQAGSACPLSGGVEGGQQKISAFLDRLAQSPLQTSAPQRPLTQ
ncbi:alpha/beta fold hydrolase, partial [Tsukamurella conjunctivitidis]|uniref:alpha/beta fold hydrolase n=1 Tax=Tsukamurella conjunctivitidis TaxID=2592068 RepID=UPI00195F7A74